jgi:glc operon protein GlcG
MGVAQPTGQHAVRQRRGRAAEGVERGRLLYRRPSKVFQDVVAGGGAGLRMLGLEGASLLEGGLPLMADGKLVGAIGVSGVTGEQDSQIAAAGVAALK